MSFVRFATSLLLCAMMIVLACLHGYAWYCLAQCDFQPYTGEQAGQKHMLLNRARMCEPDNARVYYDLGRFYDHIREQETRSDNVINMFYLAENIPGMPAKPTAIRSKCLELAMDAYGKAIDRDPRNALYHYRLGRVYLDVPIALDEFAREKALNELKEAMELDPTNGLYHYWLGIYYQTQGSLDGAISKYRDAIRHDPDLAVSVFRTVWDIDHYPPSLQAIAQGREDLETKLPEFLLQAGNTAGARAACVAACQKADGFSVEHQVRLLRCLIRLKEAALTRLFALEWLEYRPAVPLEMMLVSGMEEGGRRDLAIGRMEKVTTRNPASAKCHARLADLYQAAGRFEDVVREYEKAIEIEPRQSDYYERLADLYRRQGNFAAAVIVYQRLAEVFPENPLVHYRIGAACMAAKDFDGAVAAFRLAVELAPDNPTVRRALAMAAGLKAQRDAPKSPAKPGAPPEP
ncbi:MAG: tetratricopeptide repeat protein [Planctomycetota bacterium]